jgi:hypothetical protein
VWAERVATQSNDVPLLNHVRVLGLIQDIRLRGKGERREK